MSIRKKATLWLGKNQVKLDGILCASKYYEASESWIKKPAWAFEIPIKKLGEPGISNVCLLAEKNSQPHEFYCLKIPKEYILNSDCKCNSTSR